jgi:AraC family transcriptional regulator
MTQAKTRIDYGRRIARVTAYIAEHLDAPLSVEALAAVAYFSPWHFHRIYRETTGETVTETVRRLRLHRAAGELIRDETPLERVAHRAGYGSLAAFSRAFSGDYGAPPGRYRQRGKLTPGASRNQQEEIQMYEVDIKPFEGVRLAAVGHRGDYQEIGQSFDRVVAWAAGAGALGPSTRSFGIYYDDPRSVRVEQLRSDAGIVVAEDRELDGDVRAVEIPPLLCASVIHKGPYAELERPYGFLYREWLPKSGREPADHPCFEEYLNDARAQPPSEWLTRIYLPLKG